MKAAIHITVESEIGKHVQEIACWERNEYRLEDIGLTLARASACWRLFRRFRWSSK
jgi:hypothetical protein